MSNNDILRRIRYTFDISDPEMGKIFGLTDPQVTLDDVKKWLKKDGEPEYKELKDKELAAFLNGFIIERRGKKEGPLPQAEKRLTNNLIFRKLNIALKLKSDAVLAILDLADFRMSKHELSAFFRKPGHKHYRVCKDQILRNFLNGMQIKYRSAYKT